MRSRLFLTTLLVLLVTLGVFAEGRGIRIPRGETAFDAVVSVAEPVMVDGMAAKGLFTAGANVTIAGTVRGDVALIGGRLELKEGAVVEGNVLLVGSQSVLPSRAAIKGKLFTAPLLGSEANAMFRDPVGFLFHQEYGAAAIATRLFVSLFWFAIALVLAKMFPAHVDFACRRLKTDPGYNACVGLVGALGLLVAVLVTLALCLALVGIPLFIIVALFIIASSLFGMTVFLYVSGDLLSRLLHIGRRTPLVSLVLAVTVWTLLRFLPGLSFLVQLTAFALGMGIVLTTRFGTGTPWIRKAPAHPAPRGA